MKQIMSWLVPTLLVCMAIFALNTLIATDSWVTRIQSRGYKKPLRNGVHLVTNGREWAIEVDDKESWQIRRFAWELTDGELQFSVDARTTFNDSTTAKYWYNEKAKSQIWYKPGEEPKQIKVLDYY